MGSAELGPGLAEQESSGLNLKVDPQTTPPIGSCGKFRWRSTGTR